MDGAKQKILVCGNVNGKFKQLFNRLETVNKKTGPFDLLLCVGEFFSGEPGGNAELEAYRNGNKHVAVPTYILGPGSAATRSAYDAANANGDLCPNLTYLGKRGLYTISSGIRVAYVSGVEVPKGDVAQSHNFTIEDVRATRNSCLASKTTAGEYRGVDILITAQWPLGVNGADQQQKPPDSGAAAEQPSPPLPPSTLLAYLAHEIRPRYHFCAAAAAYFERVPYRNAAGPNSALEVATRFVALAPVGNAAKEKYIYALSVTPVDQMRVLDLIQKTTNETTCPYDTMRISQAVGAGAGAAAAAEAAGGGGAAAQFFFDMKASQPGGKRRSTGGPQTAGAGSGPTSEKRPRRNFDQEKCWFCLSSASVERHLVVTVGEHFYMALAKGPLNTDHCLLLPVTHVQCGALLSAESWRELGRFKEALVQMNRAGGKQTFFFERNYRSSHLQINVVAVRQDEVAAGAVKAAFATVAKKYDLQLEEIPALRDPADLPRTGPYFVAEMPGKEVLLTRQMKMFPLHFGREVFCSAEVLRSEQKVDWKQCELQRDEEVELVGKLRAAFKAYNFAEQDN